MKTGKAPFSTGDPMDVDRAFEDIRRLGKHVEELKAILQRLNSNGVHIAVLIDPMRVIPPGTINDSRFPPSVTERTPNAEK